MRIDHPDAGLIPKLRSLWKEAFGDSDAFLDCFFTTAYVPSHCRCITESGAVQAALYWLDMTCEGQKLAYIYAVVTVENCRGRGLCRALMDDTAAVLSARGYQGAILVPEDEALSRMYGKMGYLPAADIDEFTCAAAPSSISLREISAPQYARLRTALLPPGSVRLEERALAFLAAQARFYEAPGVLAAVSPWEDHLRVLEFLGDRSRVPALVAELGYMEATVRAPGGTAPFAMYRPLTPDCRKPEYFAFCFD